MNSEYRWWRHFIKHAQLDASKSKDRSTQVGAVIVDEENSIIAHGYNGFPRGVDDNIEERHERPEKYAWTEHAERNAIFNAARKGIPLRGTTLVLNFEPCPCADCTRAIIQSGIKKVVGPNYPFVGKGKQWEYSLATSKQMMKEAGIETLTVDMTHNYE